MTLIDKNKKETWHKWLPEAQNLSKKYVITLIEDIIGEFNIYLYDEKSDKKIRVNFYESTDIFRRTNIGFRSTELKQISDEQGEAFFSDWTFFKISNSEYVRELFEESCGMLNAAHCIHFVIVGDNCIVDVITDHEPKIEFIEKEHSI